MYMIVNQVMWPLKTVTLSISISHVLLY